MPSSASRANGSGLVYAVANQKGGVGKTTTCVNTAVCLAEAGATTLLIDLDPQCNATHSLGLDESQAPGTSYDVLSGNVTSESAIASASISNLYIIPSTPEMAGAAVELPQRERREFILADSINAISRDFAYIFIDCPPSLCLLTVNALVAADKLIVPVQCEYFALEGLGQLLKTVAAVQSGLNPRLQIAGLLMTMYDPRTRLSAQVIGEVRSHFPNLTYRTVIPRNVRLSEAPSFGKPISHYDPACAGSDAYFDLATEVVERE
ncbi:MAG: ParA family protein [Thermoleophilia bacterium]|nr:ParA family protein [Thermoleophilia bacterium]